MNKTGKTGFLYTTKNGEFKEKQEFFVEFDDFLNEGTYRECYLGQYLNEDKEEIPGDVYGTGDCVVKIPKKNSYNLKFDFICSEFANNLAIKYNREVAKISKKIKFILPYGAKLEEFKGEKITDNTDNIIVSVEPYIGGDFYKYFNNDGSPLIKDDSLSAFSHYTWIINKGRKVITDLQGVRKDDNRFILTDPACQSLGRDYGDSDLGVQGLMRFILNHECNDICGKWKWINIDEHFKLPNNEKETIKSTKVLLPKAKTNKYLEVYKKLLESVEF